VWWCGGGGGGRAALSNDSWGKGPKHTFQTCLWRVLAGGRCKKKKKKLNTKKGVRHQIGEDAKWDKPPKKTLRAGRKGPMFMTRSWWRLGKRKKVKRGGEGTAPIRRSSKTETGGRAEGEDLSCARAKKRVAAAPCLPQRKKLEDGDLTGISISRFRRGALKRDQLLKKKNLGTGAPFDLQKGADDRPAYLAPGGWVDTRKRTNPREEGAGCEKR